MTQLFCLFFVVKIVFYLRNHCYASYVSFGIDLSSRAFILLTFSVCFILFLSFEFTICIPYFSNYNTNHQLIEEFQHSIAISPFAFNLLWNLPPTVWRLNYMIKRNNLFLLLALHSISHNLLSEPHPNGIYFL